MIKLASNNDKKSYFLYYFRIDSVQATFYGNVVLFLSPVPAVNS